MKKTVRIGIVGARHFHVFDTLASFGGREDVEVVGLVETDSRLRDRLRRVHPLPCFESFEEFVERAGPDAVALHNAPAERAGVICHCARLGIHVWTDKPVALTQEELRGVREALSESRIAFMMTVAGGYSSLTHDLRERFGRGDLGELVQLVDAGQHRFELPAAADWRRLPWELDSAQSGGLIVQMAIHGISRFLWLAESPVVSVSAVQGNTRFRELPGFEDHCAVTLATESGSKAVVQASWLLPDAETVHSRNFLSVLGSKGFITTHGTGVAHGLEANKGESGGTVVTDDAAPRPFEPGPGPGRSAVEDFLACIRNGKEPLVGTDFLLETMRVALMAREAARRGETLRTDP